MAAGVRPAGRGVARASRTSPASPTAAPTLPGFALGDGVGGLAGAFGVLAALRHRDATGAGRSIDLSLFEPLHWLLGPQSTIYDQTGVVPTRTGDRVDFTAPRNAYAPTDTGSR